MQEEQLRGALQHSPRLQVLYLGLSCKLYTAAHF